MGEPINIIDLDGPFVIKSENYQIQQIPITAPPGFMYLVTSNQETALIHPIQDITLHIEKIKSHKLNIKYIIDTSYHSDLKLGYQELKEKLNCEVYIGPQEQDDQKPGLIQAKDGDSIKLGDLELEFILTPGLTQDNLAVALKIEGDQKFLFPSELILLNEITKPDKDLAKDQFDKICLQMYNSLKKKILTLEDQIVILPYLTLQKENQTSLVQDTLGGQKKTNPYLQLDRLTFCEEMNKNSVVIKVERVGSRKSTFQQKNQATAALDNFQNLSYDQLKNYTVLDLRSNNEGFFIKNSYYVDPNLPFKFINKFFGFKDQIAFICQQSQSEVLKIMFLKQGYENFKGFFDKFDEIPQEDKIHIKNINAEDFVKLYNANVIDIREKDDSKIRLKNSKNIPVDELNNHLKNIDENQTYYIHCYSGKLQLLAQSYLLVNGHSNIVNIQGGFAALKNIQAQDIIDSPIQELQNGIPNQRLCQCSII